MHVKLCKSICYPGNLEGVIMRQFFALGLIVLSVATIQLTGCEPKPTPKPSNAGAQDHGHDHGHDHPQPKSLADAIKMFEEYRGKIKTAFADKKPEDAHGALHEIGEAIMGIEKFALAASTTDEAKNATKGVIKDLIDSFGDIDKTLHGQEGKSYDEVAAKVDAAVAALNAMAK
jgi:uncharacterized protein YukE